MDDIDFKEIPKEFYSDLNQGIFKNCTFCSTDLSFGFVTYLIEKSFKINPSNGMKNTVFEYAICSPCNVKKLEAMSEESIENIKKYMLEHFKTLELELSNENRDPFSKCVVTGIPVEDLEEYSIVGQFVGDKMIKGQFPVLMSPSIGVEIQELLSQKTKDEFDEFMSEITGVPPELKELFKIKRPVLI